MNFTKMLFDVESLILKVVVIIHKFLRTNAYNADEFGIVINLEDKSNIVIN